MLKKTKRILITAGPTWVKIDSVRVITNIFTGKLGFLIAREAVRRGFDATLFLGPGQICLPANLPKKMEIIRFHYFDELYQGLKEKLKSRDYGIMVHTAAVPDYVPRKIHQGKIRSGNKNLSISFKPTVKIVDLVKKWDKDVFLVKFKLEAGSSKEELLAKAYQSMMHSNADLIVANDLTEMAGGGQKAYIMDKGKRIETCDGKKDIAEKLINLIEKIF